MTKSEYKTICDRCGLKTWYETEQPCKATIWIGCKTCGSHAVINREVKCSGTLRLIDNTSLIQRATPFYESKERVEITYKDGTKTRCYIGKSTGWKPIYLEILKRNSYGGSSLYLPDEAKIKGLGIYFNN